MARAFVASVPLALVLVAAVIVPVAVTPGSFGFHGWPEPPQQLAVETPVVVQVAGQAPAAPARGAAARPEEARAATLAQAPSATRAPAPSRRGGHGAASGSAPQAGSPGRELAQAPHAHAPGPASPAAPAPAPPQASEAPAVPQAQIAAPQAPAAGHHGVSVARADTGGRALARRPHGRRDGRAGPAWGHARKGNPQHGRKNGAKGG